MDTSTSTDSSGTSSNVGFCACCHNSGRRTPHWDHPDIWLCSPCRHLLFAMAGHHDLTHVAYSFHNRIAAGGL